MYCSWSCQEASGSSFEGDPDLGADNRRDPDPDPDPDPDSDPDPDPGPDPGPDPDPGDHGFVLLVVELSCLAGGPSRRGGGRGSICGLGRGGTIALEQR